MPNPSEKARAAAAKLAAYRHKKNTRSGEDTHPTTPLSPSNASQSPRHNKFALATFESSGSDSDFDFEEYQSLDEPESDSESLSGDTVSDSNTSSDLDDLELSNDAKELLFHSRLQRGLAREVERQKERRAATNRPQQYTGQAASTQRAYRAHGRAEIHKGTRSITQFFRPISFEVASVEHGQARSSNSTTHRQRHPRVIESSDDEHDEIPAHGQKHARSRSASKEALEPARKRARVDVVQSPTPPAATIQLQPTEALAAAAPIRNVQPWKDMAALKMAQAKLSALVKKSGHGVLFHRRLETMLATLNLVLDRELKLSMRKASDLARRAVRHKKAYALRLRQWIFTFMRDGTLPTHRLGLSTSVLRDEDFAQDIHLHLLELSSKGRFISAADVVAFVSTEEMRARLGGKTTISEHTARRWLHAMSWRFSKDPKGMYIDGHERADVVAYRSEFLGRWSGYERRMRLFHGDGTVSKEPQLLHTEQQLVLYTHDESTFYANDRRKTIWTHSSAVQPKAKGEGESLMVGDFLSPEFGRLRTEEACVFVP